MPSNGRPVSDFVRTRAIYASLEHALTTKLFSRRPALKKAAENTLREMQHVGSIFGRQMRMIEAMRKGASIEELGRKLRASRRTIFRYLSDLHDAGITISLKDGRYHVQTVEDMD